MDNRCIIVFELDKRERMVIMDDFAKLRSVDTVISLKIGRKKNWKM